MFCVKRELDVRYILVVRAIVNLLSVFVYFETPYFYPECNDKQFNYQERAKQEKFFPECIW